MSRFIFFFIKLIDNGARLLAVQKDQKLCKSRAFNFIAGRPKAALLFWFFSDFICDVPLFIVFLLYINIKIGKIDVNC